MNPHPETPVTIESVIYKFCIHELNGKYQWRWMLMPPPEADGKLAISPEFDTLQEAIEWGKSNTPTVKRTIWTPVSLDPKYECLTKRS